MTLAPYPQYRPTGIEWLGEVPEHWEVKRLKYVASVNGGQSPSSAAVNSDGVGLPFLQGNAEFGRHHPKATKACASPAKTADPRDILFSVRAPVGAMNVADQKYGIGRGLVAIRSDRDAPFCDRFLFYYLLFARRRLHAVATGSTYAAVSVSDVECLPVIDPGYEMRGAIVEYLDREMAKLDAFVRKQQTLIERLREKRSALITETVTRGLPPDAARAAGLDPNPPRKPSGVEWLGDLPAHWETKRLGRLLRNDEDKVEADEDARLPYVGMEQVESGTGRLLSIDPTFTPSGVSNRFAAGDILYGKLRPYLAKACCVDFDGLSSSELLALRTTGDTDRRFLLYQLLADGFVGLMDACSYGTKMPRTSWDLVRAVVVGVPALKEQRAIADYLDRETAKLDALVGKIETAIERLREYRSALITAAVTGKVDVRSARQPTPAEKGPAREAPQP